MLTKYRLKGHESFVIREGWITKALFAINQNPQLFSAAAGSGADALGVGTNMAKAIRFWMRAAGLTKESSTYGVTLSNLGSQILENDPYIEDIFTLWLLHIKIASNDALSTSWYLFFNKLGVSSFKRDELSILLRDLLYEETEAENLSERSIKDDASAILAMYCADKESEDDPEDKKESPFRALGILEQEGRLIEKRYPDSEKLNPMLVLYIISSLFETQTSEHKSITIDELAMVDNGPGKVLNLTRIMLNEYLDRLQNKGYLVVNRTAGLDIVYEAKTMSPYNVVKEYYQERSTTV